MTTDDNTIPSLAEIAAAKEAADDNAPHWIHLFGKPFDGAQQTELLADGHALDDVHADTIGAALGLDEGALSREQAARVWPVYRAALELKVYELLAQEKG